MGKYIKLFNTHSEYESYVESGLILPNVSYCIDTPDEVHYNPFGCEEMTNWEVIDSSYPSTIEGASSSFDIIIRYRKIDTDTACTETVTEGEDSVTVECGANPSTADTRAVSGNVIWNDNEITYSLTQEPKDTRLIAKFNVTDTSKSTLIVRTTTNISKIEIDGVRQQSVPETYRFNTTGEHTVKYTLKDPTSIYTSTFESCSSITSVIIPDGVTIIGYSAFTNCSGLTSITIPDSVTSIDYRAFGVCRSLTSITIPSGVTSIGDIAFSGCRSLTSIDIPDSVTSIGSSAFQDCRSLTSVTIGGGVTSIGDRVFYQCSGLTSVDIPDSVTSIGEHAFAYCIRLTNVTIGTGVTSIGNYVFYQCSGLTSCTIGSGVTSIGASAFTNCYNLTSIDIPDSVTSINYDAFTYCTSLTSVTIGSGVTSIGTAVFQYCTGLTSIICNAIVPPTLGSGVFNYTNNCPIYVPCNSVDTYKEASYWSTYASRIQAIPGSCS